MPWNVARLARRPCEDHGSSVTISGSSVWGDSMGKARKRWVSFAMASVVGLAAAPMGAHGSEPLGSPTPTSLAAVESFDPLVSVPTLERAANPPVRIHFGRAEIYLPTFFQPEGGSYDLIVHFHGMASVQESNIERARLNAAIVSVNLGFGSEPYEEAFRNPLAFPRLVAVVSHFIEQTGKTHGAHLGRIALATWSAGYGAAAAILRQTANANRIDALLMAEGPHSDYVDKEHTLVDEAPLAKYLRIARAARAGDKLFVLTHSAIHTDDYPSTTETIGELLKMAAVEKTASSSVGPRGMQQVYESDSGDFHVKGYEGGGVKDHVDHIRAMGETMFPYLKRRWAR
jgi:hypothetical protein